MTASAIDDCDASAVADRLLEAAMVMREAPGRRGSLVRIEGDFLIEGERMGFKHLANLGSGFNKLESVAGDFKITMLVHAFDKLTNVS